MSNLARCSVITEVGRSRGLGSLLVQMSYIDILYSHASCNALLVHIISADNHPALLLYVLLCVCGVELEPEQPRVVRSAMKLVFLFLGVNILRAWRGGTHSCVYGVLCSPYVILYII